MAIAATPEMTAQGQADAHRLVKALAPWSSGSSLLNFTEEPVDTRLAFGRGTFERLQAVRAHVDPDGRFVANHPVPAARRRG